MIELVYFIFEEPADLPTGQVHFVLILNLLFFNLVEEFNEVEDGIGKKHSQGLSFAEEDVLLDEMALSQ